MLDSLVWMAFVGDDVVDVKLNAERVWMSEVESMIDVLVLSSRRGINLCLTSASCLPCERFSRKMRKK